MPAARSRVALALLLLAPGLLAQVLLGLTLPTVSRAANATPVSARALVDSVASRYSTLGAYHVSGVSQVKMVMDSGGEPRSAATPFVFAARWPSRVHNEIMNPNQPICFVADGESLAVYALGLNQHIVVAAPRVVPGQVPAGDFGGAMQPLAGIGNLAKDIVSAVDLGPDTVQAASGPVGVRKLRLEYAPDTTRRALTVLPRMLWVDPVHDVLWRDVISVHVSPPGQPAYTTVQTMRFVTADIASGGPDSLYRITPRAGSQRVERLGPAPPPPPAIVGKPAKDFTLSPLTGLPVHLAALRGKIVVLDFWATWCGPCRAWMPTVAKVEKELKGRNVRFYAVNERDTAEKVRAFLKTSGTTVPVLLDPSGQVGVDYDARAIPLTVIVGANGKVVDALVGLHTEADLRAALRTAGVTGL